jgi:hypothetical protein
MMWELVYADGKVTEFEDNVVWRASELLGISARDRIDQKHLVAARRADEALDSRPVRSAGAARDMKKV